MFRSAATIASLNRRLFLLGLVSNVSTVWDDVEPKFSWRQALLRGNHVKDTQTRLLGELMIYACPYMARKYRPILKALAVNYSRYPKRVRIVCISRAAAVMVREERLWLPHWKYTYCICTELDVRINLFKQTATSVWGPGFPNLNKDI